MKPVLVIHGGAGAMIAQARRESAGLGFIAPDKRGQISALTSTNCLIWASAESEGLTFF